MFVAPCSPTSWGPSTPRNFPSGVLAADQAVQGAATGEPLHVHAVGNEAAAGLPLVVVLLAERREAHLAGDVDLLAARELELRAAERLRGDIDLLLLRADGDQHLADLHARRGAVGLTEGPAHARRPM